MLDDMWRFPRITNWACLVRNLLQNLGFGDVWMYQGVGDDKQFLSIFKIRLKDVFIQEWHARLLSSTRARFYVHLANNFGYKTYLNDITIAKFRFSVTRLRCSSHRLQVEVGRWHKPLKIPFNERTCMLCDVLEDEFHFIFECPLYGDLRSCYLSQYFLRKQSMYKLLVLLESSQKKVIRNLGMYLYKAFKLRNEVFYRV